MFTLLLLFILLFVLIFAASRWGVDSTDRFDSPEWERRNMQSELSYSSYDS